MTTTLKPKTARRTFAQHPIFTRLNLDGETYTYQIDSYNREEGLIEVRNIHTQVTSKVSADLIQPDKITTDVKGTYKKPNIDFYNGAQVFLAML